MSILQVYWQFTIMVDKLLVYSRSTYDKSEHLCELWKFYVTVAALLIGEIFYMKLSIFLPQLMGNYSEKSTQWNAR